MKIVLVRPSDLRGDVSILSHATPINLGYLAAYLIKNGYEVEIWDYETQQFFEQDFIQKSSVLIALPPPLKAATN